MICHKLYVWYRWRRRQKFVKRLKEEAEARVAQKMRATRDIFCNAVQDIILTHGPAPGGVMIIDKVRRNIERWAPISANVPQTKRDFIFGCEWWEVDTSHSYNNARKLSIQEVTDYLKD